MIFKLKYIFYDDIESINSNSTDINVEIVSVIYHD
jgi:hypothetical protein